MEKSFDSFFDSIITENSCDIRKEFFGPEGQQHYRLFAYLSTLYDNINIIDIGTHRGSSAAALSYNPSNQIYSFDIEDKVTNFLIRSTKNITFVIDDLFTIEGRNKWEKLILSSPLIILDIDPHNGLMEMDFYNYLKSINYKGVMICDDIWYFENMRTHFWYLIPNDEKYDLTAYGHFSGTGAILFNSSIPAFPTLRCNDDWTLVTAYFNLTKCHDASDEIKSRDKNYYINHARATMASPYNLIVYTDEETLPKLKALRPSFLKDRTQYKVWDFENIKIGGRTFSELREHIIQNRCDKPYYFDPRNTASYYLFCMSRYVMLLDTISENPFGSTHFAWINICIERMGYKNIAFLDEALRVHRDKFSTAYIDYIPDFIVSDTPVYFQWGRCSMCSGFFTGRADYMSKTCSLIQDKFLEYLELGYGHADEQLYSPVYFQNKDLFEHYFGDYQEMISNYVTVNDKPEKIIDIFIPRSYDYDKTKCYEACLFVKKGRAQLTEKQESIVNYYLYLLTINAFL